ncbi:hypothetical protein OTU49_007759 [Cherax quadricarinatus]|uniref:Probable U3 small nucleolar RNA-associated protein 11 n=1 Tax=Cherax quadricarinatus TaxID=27406 RepID=A0AAW0YML0_CHEQU
MINSGLKDGIHFEKVENEELAVGDVMQDLVYITHRLTIEKKKIEKLKAQLHVLDMEDDEPKNTHIIFVDDEKEAKKADPAKLLDTHPSLLNRSFNRLHSSQLSSLDNNLHDQALLTENKAKNGEKPKLVKPGTNTSAPIYQWPKQRKT